jgi:hypothetical protein
MRVCCVHLLPVVLSHCSRVSESIVWQLWKEDIETTGMPYEMVILHAETSDVERLTQIRYERLLMIGYQ